MDKYKVTLLRLGQAHIMSETKETAVSQAQNLLEDEVVWLAEADGLPGKYLVVLADPEKD